MRISPKWGAFAAFTAVFAVCAAFVFWGTWALDMAPVMPDCPTAYPVHWFKSAVASWLGDGKFAPAEAICWIGSPYIWNEFRYAFAAYMAALGLAYFLRGRGLDRASSYGAGLLLAFSGYWFTLFSAGHLGWFQWMTYGVFVFGLVDRALEKGKTKHWLLLGACLAWGSMRQTDMWLLFSAFSSVYFLFRAIVVFRLATCDARRATIVRWVKGSAIALVALLAIGGASFRSAFVNDLAGRDKQIEEGQTLGANAAKDDAEKRWIFTTNWSMPPEATKEFFCSRIEGDTSCPMTIAIGQKRGNGIRPYTGRLGRPLGAPSGNYRQHSLYVGWMTCLLALLGVGSLVLGLKKVYANRDSRQPMTDSRRTGTVVFFAVAAVVFWLFSMGRFCEPIYRVVYALPFGDYLRAPVKWHHLTEFCICVLAGFGLNAVFRLVGRAMGERSTRLYQIAAVVILAFVGVVDLVRNDRLFCAPHRADAEMQFVDGRITKDPRGIAQLNQMRARVIGSYANAALIEIPKVRNAKDPEIPEPQLITLCLGILSLVGTIAAGVYGVKKS